MPATCPALIHHFSLLLLVGLHLLVGSLPLGPLSSSSSSSSADRAYSASTAGTPGPAPARQEDSSRAWPLPREREIPEPPAASLGAPAPGGHGSTASGGGGGGGGAAMTDSEKVVESPNAKTEILSRPVHNTDAFSSLGSGEGRTLWTTANSVPASTAVTGSSAYHPKRIRSRHLAHVSSPAVKARTVDDAASASPVDMAALQTTALSIGSPKTFLASETNHLATENIYHIDSSWTAGSTTSYLHSESMGSSTKMNRDTERTALFLTAGVPLTDSTRRNAISAGQIVTSVGQAWSLSHATRSRGISSTSDVASLPDSSVGTVLTHSYFSPISTAEDRHLPGSSLDTDRTVSSSPVESTSIVGLFERSREKTLRTLRDVSSSYSATQKAPAFSNSISNSDSPHTGQTRQMDLSPGTTELAGAMVPHSQAPSEITAAEDSNQSRSSVHRDGRVLSSHTDSGTVPGLSDRDEERTLQSLRDNATERSTAIDTKSSSTVELARFSSVSTPVETTQTDKSARVTTEAAILNSQAPLRTTAVEESGLLRSSSNTKTSVPSSHGKNVSTVGESSNSEDMILQTLKDTSSFYNATQIPTVSRIEPSSNLGLTDSSYASTAVQMRQMDLSPGNADARNITPPETTVAEDGGLLRWSSNTKEDVSSSEAESISVAGIPDRVRERTLRTLRDVSSSLNAPPRATTSSNEVFSSLGLIDASSVLTPVEAGQVDLSNQATPGNADISLLETTAVEDSSQPRSSSETERDLSRPPVGSSTSSDLPDRSGERTLQTLRDLSPSHNATQVSIISGKEISSSLDLIGFSSMLTPVQTGHTDLSPGHTVYTEGAVTESQPASEATVEAVEDGGLLRWSSSTEKGVSTPESEGDPVPDLFDKGEDGTLETLKDAGRSHHVAQGATVSTRGGTLYSLALTDSSSPLTPVQTEQVDWTAGDMEFTEAMLIHSQAPSEITDVKDDQRTLSHSSTEKRDAQTESMFSAVTLVRSGDGTLRSLTHRMKSTDVTELSMIDLEDVSSSVLTQTSFGTAQSGNETSPSTGTDRTESLKDLLLTYSSKTSIYPSSTLNLSSPGSSPQGNKGPDEERRPSSAATDSVYRSTAFTHGGARTLRSLPDNSTSAIAIDSSTYTSENSKPSEPLTSETLTSVAEMEKQNASLSDVQSTGPSTEHFPENSSFVPMYSSSPKASSASGSSHQSVRSSNVPPYYTESTSTLASFSNGEGVVKSAFAPATESPSLSRKELDTSEVNPSFPEAFSKGTDSSSEHLGTYGSSTETLQSLPSSRTPSYFSLQSEPSDTETDSHPMNSTDTGQRTSVSHTDSTFTSTTFTKGGERTLLSLLNSSALPVSSESATFHVEMSSHSELTQSSFSENQSRRSNTSPSDMGFPGPSTEPLAVHSQNTPAYISTESEPQTTRFTSKSESTFSSSSFPPSLPTSQKQDSYPSTQLPTLFSSSEPSFPSLSSAFPSALSSTPQTPSVTFSLLSSTMPLPFPSLRPSVSSSSSSVQPSGSLETSVSVSASERTTGTDPHAVESAHTEHSHQTRTYLLKDSTVLSSTGPSPLPTEITEQLTNQSSPITISLEETKAASGQNISLQETDNEKTVPRLTTSPVYLTESTTISETAKATTPTLASTTTPTDAFNLVETTRGKKLAEATYTTLRIPTLVAGTDVLVSTKPPKAQPSSTTITYKTETPTKKLEKTSTTTTVVQEHIMTTTQPPIAFSSSRTSRGAWSVSPVSTKATTNGWVGSANTFTASLGKAGNLCKHKDPECDKETSVCVDLDGTAVCQCRPGYFKYNRLDHSCRACEDGYKLENDTCVSCPFGLGGFNCGNPYQLITTVIAAAGGGLLLILGIALIVTCCQKNKNDISKFIFKSGDFQMSPYAEYPKNPRAQDWGREAIEMQENGSTKNLLQMTDVYYMPTNLRNPELERNGIYPPYTGLPGSRHSCIYPGQYNPSFISDDTRRRDYF